MKFRDEVPAFTKLNSRKDFCNRENKISDKFQIKQRRFQISFRLHAWSFIMTKENALTFYLKRQGVFLKDQDDFFFCLGVMK